MNDIEVGTTKRSAPPAAKRRFGMVVGGLLAYALGGPLGFFAACLFIFLVRLLRALRTSDRSL